MPQHEKKAIFRRKMRGIRMLTRFREYEAGRNREGGSRQNKNNKRRKERTEI